YRKEHQCTGLLFLGNYPRLDYFGRQQCIGASHTVLYVHRCNIGIYALFKKDTYSCASVVTGSGSNIRHSLHPVDLFFNGNNYTLKHGGRIGTGKVRGNLNGWWGYFWILGRGKGSYP